MSPCPICARPDSRLLYRVRDDTVLISRVTPPLEIHRCRGCGLTFARGGLPEPDLKELYEAAWKKTWGPTFEQSPARVASYAAAQVTYVETLIPPGRVLDVGCGNGLFLEAASVRGWEVAGIELSPAAAAAARERVGPRVTLGTLEEADLRSDAFDVVTLWEVIEHVPHPLRLLSEVRRVLRPGGMLFLSTPNAHSIFHRIARWSYILTLGFWTFPARRIYFSSHRYYFTKQTLSATLLKAGFDTLRFPPPPSKGWGVFDDVDLLFEANQGEAWARIPLIKPAIRFGLAVGRRAGVPYRLICCARKNTSPGTGVR